MRTIALLSLVLLPACRCGDGARSEIRVISDRTEDHLAPIFAAYAKATAVPIDAAYARAGLVARLESRPTEADVVITRDADVLEVAASRGLLQPLDSRRIEQAVPPEHRSADGLCFSECSTPSPGSAATARVGPTRSA